MWDKKKSLFFFFLSPPPPKKKEIWAWGGREKKKKDLRRNRFVIIFLHGFFALGVWLWIRCWVLEGTDLCRLSY